MVLSANVSAVGDAAGAVLIIVENLPVLGLVGGIVLSSAAALLPEALACVDTYDAASRGSAEAAADVRERADTARNRTSFNLPVPGVAQELSAAPPILST
jgi:hypothetical protein